MIDTIFPLVKLSSVLEPIKRAETPLPGIQYRQIGVRLWGAGAYEREPVDGGATRYKTFYRVEEGDIVVNKIWARNGSVAVVTKALAGCYASSEFPIFTPQREQMLSQWFHWITKTRWFWAQCDEKSRGTSGKNRIRPEKFLEIEIPLPPLEEQRRIVARVEALTEKINVARRLRQEAVEEAKKIVSGKINQIIDKNISSGQWGTSLLPEIALPSRYAIKRGPFGSHLRKEFFVSEGYKVYEQKHAIYGDFDAGTYYIDKQKFEELRAFEVRPGDLIISCSGTIGKVAIVPEHAQPGIINQALLKISLDPQKMDKRFFKMVFGSDFIMREVLSISPGSAMKNIGSVKVLKRIKFPSPSLEEQRRIVAYLDGLQAKVNALRALQEETQKELDALLPSVLDKAFRGEL